MKCFWKSSFISGDFLTGAFYSVHIALYMEFTRGEWLWDYTRFRFNYQGRIALNPSIRFGIGGMIFLYVLQPIFVKLTEKMNRRLFEKIVAIMGILFAADVLVLIIK